MIFRQLFDADTSTYTYLLGDEATREAVLIDPVREQVERDVQLLEELGLTLVAALETHVHADHVTGGGALRARLGSQLCVGKRAGVLTADVQLEDGDVTRFGAHELETRFTPGHTAGCVTFVCHAEAMAFTGDALLIRGCGRTDFQQGDAPTLYASVKQRILSLPDETRIYPGHDYRGFSMSTVAEEKRFNRRLSEGTSLETFTKTMDELSLAFPKRIDESVPANMASGITEPEPLLPQNAHEEHWAPVRHTKSGVPVVEPEWVASQRGAIRIVDVREHMEFCGPLGHIAGAQLVPLAELARAARTWNRNDVLVTACAYGTRSAKAAQLLREEGFEQVASLYGGMTRWNAHGLPVVGILGDRLREDAFAEARKES